MLVAFLQERSDATRFKGQLSGNASINGSAFMVGASDRRPVNARNRIVKYSDDTYVILGASKRVTVQEELNNVAAWAAPNNLKLNATKSREIDPIDR